MCKLRSIRHSQIDARNPTSCLAKSRIVAQTPEPEAFQRVFGLGGSLNEMPCLVKDLTCVGSTFPHTMIHVLVHLLASRAQQRFHQPCSISSLLRPARRCSRCQQHASGCMQAPFSKNLSCLNNVVRSAPPSKPAPNSCLAAFSHNCPSIEARKACQNPQSSIPTPPALRLHLLPSGSCQDACRMEIQLCCKSITLTTDKCPRTCLQLVVGLFCPDFPDLGPGSLVVFPNYEPLPDEITRDLDCWIGVWTQQCDRGGLTPASTSALCSFRRSRPRLLDPRCRRPHSNRSVSFLRPGLCFREPRSGLLRGPLTEPRTPFRLPALVHLLAMVRRIGFLALDTSRPKYLA